MPGVSVIRSWVQSVVQRRRVDDDLDAELQFHLEQQIQEGLTEGLSLAEARAAALRTFGSVTFTKEAARESLGLRLVDELSQDVRLAARSLMKTPGFTAIALLTLALGIGANAAIFTLLDGVMFKPLRVPAANELVTFYENGPEGPADATGGTGRFLRFSYPRFERLETALGKGGSLAAVTRSGRFAVQLPGDDSPRFLQAQLVSSRFFDTIATPATQGRLITADDVQSEQPVAVISEAFWNRAFQRSAAAIGQPLTVNGVAVTVVGVAARGFNGLWSDAEAQLWLPLTLQRALHYANNSSSYGRVDNTAPWTAQDAISWLNLVARIPEMNRPAAVAALQAANRDGVAALASTFPDPKTRPSMLAHALVVEPIAHGFSGLRSQYSAALLLLAALVAAVLLVTCANIANLLLTCAAGQARDLGTRISLGASTGRLIRQQLTEAIALASIAGTAGYVVGRWASAVLARQVLNTTAPLPLVFSADVRIFAFTASASLFTALAFGLAPALRAINIGKRGVLGVNHRPVETTTALMKALVAGQLAFSIVIVFMAILLGRTLINFTHIDLGFSADHLITASFDPVTSRYPAADMPAFSRRLVAALSGLPGVSGVSVSRCGLIAGCASSSGFRLEGTEEGGKTLYENWVTKDYFKTTGIPLLRGRAFDERDNEQSSPVAIVNASIAERYFPGGDAVGRRLGFSQLDTEIIGVVGDARTQTVHEPPVPMVYFPIGQKAAVLAQAALTNADVRVNGDAAQSVAAVRQAIRTSEPSLLVSDVSPMSRRLDRDLSRERIVAYVASLFGALTLLLASLGLYGVLAYGVAHRTRELGVRMALGAERAQVMFTVLKQSAMLMAGGTVLGLLGSAVGARYLSGLLFGVAPLDSSTLMLVVSTFVIVMTLASWIPAHRAVRIDPIRALRQE